MRASLRALARSGLVAEWLRRGLQILAPRFDSGRGLHPFGQSIQPWFARLDDAGINLGRSRAERVPMVLAFRGRLSDKSRETAPVHRFPEVRRARFRPPASHNGGWPVAHL